MALIRLYMLVRWVTQNLFHRNKITRTYYVNKYTYHSVFVVAKDEKKRQGKKERKIKKRKRRRRREERRKRRELKKEGRKGGRGRERE